MKCIFNKVILISAMFLFFLAYSDNAHAYIDPGAGSYILQMILGALIGLIFAIKIYWQKVKTFFSNFKFRLPIRKR